MTEKEKITLKDNVIKIFNSFNVLDNGTTIGGLRDDVLRAINSIEEELASKDLEDFAKEYSFNIPSDIFHDLPKEKQALWKREIENAIVVGSKWKEEQLLKDAVERKVKIDAGGYPYIDCDIDLWDYNKGIPLAMKGDKYKLILIKED